MDVIDELLENNQRYASTFSDGDLPSQPARKLAVLACMDARLDVNRILGLKAGDAHVIRNAGGVVTEDAIRSLVISQRLLGTEEIMVIQHTGCGMLTFKDDAVKAEIERDTGLRPDFALEAFPDLEQNVRQSLARIEASPFIPSKQARGFIYDVATGVLNEVRPLNNLPPIPHRDDQPPPCHRQHGRQRDRRFVTGE
jgi:carbonic anhydrase